MNLQAILAVIDQHLEHEEWESACNLCQSTLNSQPDWVKGHDRLAQAWVGLGEIESAINAYTRCLQLQPTQVKLYANIGLLCQQTQQFSRAIAYYQQALTYHPQWTEVQFNLGMLYHQQEEWSIAIDQYEQVLHQQPTHIKAQFNLAILYEHSGHLDQAEHAYRKVLILQPEHFNAHIHLGKLYTRRKRYDAAIATYHKALELQPNSAQLFSALGQVYLAQDHLEDAMQAHQKAIAIDPFCLQSRVIMGRLWQKHHQFEQAKFHFQLVLEQSPGHLDVLHDLALTHLALSEWTDAFQCLRHIAQSQSDFVTLFCQRLEPCSADDWHGLSQLECAQFLQHLRDNKVSQAKQALLLCYQYLGQALLAYGAPQQAERYFHQALKLDTHKTDLYLGLGQSLCQQQRYEAAIAAISVGLTLCPQPPSALVDQMADIKASLQSQESERSQDNGKATHPRLYATTQDWVEAIADHAMVQPRLTHITDSPSQLTTSRVSPPNPDSDYCGGVTCQTCMDRLIQTFNPKPLGHNVFQCSMTSASILPTPPTFVVEIPNGKAWIAPHKNKWLICKEIAIFTEDKAILSDLSRFYPWYLPGCTNHKIEQHPKLQFDNMESPVRLDGQVAVLSSLSAHVYYHWMIDVLPRIGLLHASGHDLNAIDKFVVNSLSKSYQRETLQVLGIPLEKVIESDHLPYFSAPQLIVPSFPGDLDWVPLSTINFLRQSFLSGPKTSPHKYVYMSRSSAQYRQIVNEPEIIDLLQPYGFKSFNMEQFSVTQQAEIFAGADVIIAPHGAALTNLVFCKSGTTVIELFAPDYLRTDYWMISHQLTLNHYYIEGNGFQGDFLLRLMHQSSLTEDMWITPESLHFILNHLGLKPYLSK